jgi:hypothetical protein
LQQFDKTIDHIISACPILPKEQYIKRHDSVYVQLHFNIHNETGTSGKKHWYDHVPKSVKQVKEARKPYCGINKYKLTELSPTTNQTL